ncbi:MAG TPA: hypothetical protein VFF27_15965 [Bacteroidia bacterium]|jgi:hypothetical protein|nr:hypothetical protein [Bacteroidia bacterium]
MLYSTLPSSIKKNGLLILLMAFIIHANGQQTKSVSLKQENTIPYGVVVKEVYYKGKNALQLLQLKDTDLVYTFATIKNINFHNGTIEAYISGEPKIGAIASARGFVGISFRVSKDTGRAETFYIRPTNGRAQEQERRNHSLQYISHPGYPWQLLRKNTPEKYESYADLIPGEWTKIKIEVQDQNARLYINDAVQPSLIVTDLKQGKDARGTIALWIAVGTNAYFADLKINNTD